VPDWAGFYEVTYSLPEPGGQGPGPAPTLWVNRLPVLRQRSGPLQYRLRGQKRWREAVFELRGCQLTAKGLASLRLDLRQCTTSESPSSGKKAPDADREQEAPLGLPFQVVSRDVTLQLVARTELAGRQWLSLLRLCSDEDFEDPPRVSHIPLKGSRAESFQQLELHLKINGEALPESPWKPLLEGKPEPEPLLPPFAEPSPGPVPVAAPAPPSLAPVPTAEGPLMHGNLCKKSCSKPQWRRRYFVLVLHPSPPRLLYFMKALLDPAQWVEQEKRARGVIMLRGSRAQVVEELSGGQGEGDKKTGYYFRISTATGAAYDLYASTEAERADWLRAITSAAVIPKSHTPPPKRAPPPSTERPLSPPARDAPEPELLNLPAQPPPPPGPPPAQALVPPALALEPSIAAPPIPDLAPAPIAASLALDGLEPPGPIEVGSGLEVGESSPSDFVEPPGTPRMVGVDEARLVPLPPPWASQTEVMRCQARQADYVVAFLSDMRVALVAAERGDPTGPPRFEEWVQWIDAYLLHACDLEAARAMCDLFSTSDFLEKGVICEMLERLVKLYEDQGKYPPDVTQATMTAVPKPFPSSGQPPHMRLPAHAREEKFLSPPSSAEAISSISTPDATYTFDDGSKIILQRNQSPLTGRISKVARVRVGGSSHTTPSPRAKPKPKPKPKLKPQVPTSQVRPEWKRTTARDDPLAPTPRYEVVRSLIRKEAAASGQVQRGPSVERGGGKAAQAASTPAVRAGRRPDGREAREGRSRSRSYPKSNYGNIYSVLLDDLTQSDPAPARAPRAKARSMEGSLSPRSQSATRSARPTSTAVKEAAAPRSRSVSASDHRRREGARGEGGGQPQPRPKLVRETSTQTEDPQPRRRKRPAVLAPPSPPPTPKKKDVDVQVGGGEDLGLGAYEGEAQAPATTVDGTRCVSGFSLC
jgi:hypothetical protein